MINFEDKSKYGVYDLQKLIAILRAPGGCPWDAEQTHESIRRNFLEEAYEAVEAIDERSPAHLCEELGDVLTQVVFHSGIEEDAGHFDLDDVADAECRKLILRHPHVFGDVHVTGTDDVLKNWDDIKRVEKSQKTVSDSIDAVAKSLPALWRAEKIQKKAAKVGFDFPEVWQAVDKLAEELTELSDAISSETGIEEEIGDVLFSIVNVARLLKIDPEEALTKSSDKFSARFAYVESEAAKQGRILNELSLEEMDALYEQGKSVSDN